MMIRWWWEWLQDAAAAAAADGFGSWAKSCCSCHLVWWSRVAGAIWSHLTLLLPTFLFLQTGKLIFSADCQPSSSVLVFEAPQLGDSLAAQRELRDIVEIHPFEQCFVAMRRDKSAIFWGRDQEPQVFRDVTKVGVTKRGLAALKLFCISDKFLLCQSWCTPPFEIGWIETFWLCAYRNYFFVMRCGLDIMFWTQSSGARYSP